ncbi:right-handed parallel beta-helix repeat-containing protein [Fulvimonas yonginensis]|uniref:Right-handed parallel beta-helix repeat-containing protein n=1 Tax=Fulvimonas yonginensis TaxID=1495200 RepID=A0ABU8J980_9GAMM
MTAYRPSTRRDFLRHALAWAALPLLAPLTRRTCAAGWPADAAGSGTIIDVRTKGARGDGSHDDTAAIQAAIDALPAAGGVVRIPSGNYMVDATRAINLRSNMRLEMAPDAQLTALPNARKRYHVIKVWRAENVEIVGGRVVGERDRHQGEGGEWGYGINIQASRHVKVSGTHLSDCWGDGMWIGALGKGPGADVSVDVTVENVVSTNNRRQGLSIGPCQHVRIINCTFSGTHGTAPESGIDLEPMDQGDVRDVLIQGCVLTGNKGSGIEVHHHVSGLVIRQCTIRDNKGYGVLAVHASDLWIDGNTITGNGLAGVALAKRTSDVKITENTLSSNSARRLRHALKALTSERGGGGEHAGELRIDPTATNVHVSGNTFSS